MRMGHFLNSWKSLNIQALQEINALRLAGIESYSMFPTFRVLLVHASSKGRMKETTVFIKCRLYIKSFRFVLISSFLWPILIDIDNYTAKLALLPR